MNVTFINRSKTPLPKKYLEKKIQFVWRKLRSQKIIKKSGPKEISVILVDSKEAKKLNKQFRGKDYATDVLSFSGLDADSLGELILCAPVLQRQAQEHELSFRDESAYMILHGLLHLLGYEHEQGGAEAKKMLDLQDNLFAQMLG